MTHSVSSNSAAERIQYALMREEGIEPASNESVIDSLRHNFSDALNDLNSCAEERELQISEIANGIISDVAAIEPYEPAAEAIAQLQERIVTLKTQADALKAVLKSSETQLLQENIYKRQLIKTINELREAIKKLDAYSPSAQRVKDVGKQYAESVAKDRARNK